MLAGLPLPVPFACWVWPLAPLGELSKAEGLEMDVGAYKIR